MNQIHLPECLSVLGFSELEQKIYLAMLRGGTMSAYQIAKKIDISRPSVYHALEQMTEKGMTALIPNDTALYAAQPPALLLRKLRDDFTRSADAAEELLRQYTPPAFNEQYANLTGYEIILQRVKEIMRNTRTEIYLNTDMPLSPLQEELQLLRDEKNIRTVVYSFYQVGCEELCELYSHDRPIRGHEPSRLMVVSDNETALIAGPDSQGVWQASISGNRLFVKVISEHIHNDIYLLKLRNRYGREIYNHLHISTQYENRQDLRSYK